MVKISLILCVCVLPSILFAQNADEIINKYCDARGGKEKLTNVKSIYMEGMREMMGNEVDVRVTKEQGKLFRTEFDMAGATGFMLLTDKEGWNFFPMRSQTPNQMPTEAVASMQSELDIAGPLVDYTSKGYQAAFVGTDTLEGELCFKIKLTANTGKEINYWIDAKKYLMVQSSSKGVGMMFGGGRRSGSGGESEGQSSEPRGPIREKREATEIFTVYSNYKSVDGILFPHTIEIKSPNGRGGGATTFDKISLNKAVNAKLYKPE